MTCLYSISIWTAVDHEVMWMERLCMCLRWSTDDNIYETLVAKLSLSREQSLRAGYWI